MIRERLSVGITSELEETSNETHREGSSRLREQHMLSLRRERTQHILDLKKGH